MSRPRLIGICVLAAWVVGSVPFFLLTPAGAGVRGYFVQWAGIEQGAGEHAAEVPVAEINSGPGAAPVAVSDEAEPAGPTIVAPSATPRAEPVARLEVAEAELPLPTPAPADERFAILLMGYGGGQHEGGYLTDSMVVAIFDPARKSLALLSIPRDTWVPMSFDDKSTFYGKANTAYAMGKDASQFPRRQERYKGVQGAGTFAADTIARVVGVPIKYYLAIDFAGFRRGIDAVGGVEVDVPRGFAALYPANDDPRIDPSWTTVRFSSGKQQMNGERAIRYARARNAIDDSGEGSDFARSRRQRLIMEAFAARLLQPTGIIHLPRLLTIAVEHVDTNYGLPGAAPLAEMLVGWRSVQFHQTALTLGNFLEEATGPEGAYVVVPSLQDRSWAQVRAFARRLWSEPELAVASAQTPLTIRNATGVSGVAGRVSESLARLGYLVRSPVSAPLRVDSRFVDGTGGKASALARELQKDLRTSLFAGEPVGTVDGLVIELGSIDKALATFELPSDANAPTSRVGIATFGAWVPAAVATEEPEELVAIAETPDPGTSGAFLGTPGPGTPRAAVGIASGMTPATSGTPGVGTPSAVVGAAGPGTPAAVVGTPGAGIAGGQVGVPGTGTPRPAVGTPSAGTPRAAIGTPAGGGPAAAAVATAAGGVPRGTPGPVGAPVNGAASAGHGAVPPPTTPTPAPFGVQSTPRPPAAIRAADGVVQDAAGRPAQQPVRFGGFAPGR